MPKNLIINLARLGTQKSGLMVFSLEAVHCLMKIVDPKNLTILLSKDSPLVKEFSGDCKTLYVPSFLSFSSSVSKFRPILWLLYSTFLLRKNELVFSTTHHGIPGAKNQILTIHDLRPYYYPDSFAQYLYFHHLLPRIARRAAGIITVSCASKNTIHNIYQIDLKKIFVVPNFVNTAAFSPLVTKNSYDPPYLLMVGATWKHKNAHELIANAELWSRTFRLKIIAGNNNYQKKLREMIKEKGLEKNVDFLSSVSRSKLIHLYQNASALIYPSFTEGFGIPPLEAMACAIPTIVSDIDVFRELYGEVPIYVKLGDQKSWYNAFKTLEDQNTLQAKTQAGLLKAKEFNEERMCNSLLSAISSIWPEINSEFISPF